MDTLTEVLENIRASGAVIGQNLLTAPWSVRVDTGSTITVAVMLRGEGWILRDGAEPIHLDAQDIVVITGCGSVLLASDLEGRGGAHLHPRARRGARPGVRALPGSGGPRFGGG